MKQKIINNYEEAARMFQILHSKHHGRKSKCPPIPQLKKDFLLFGQRNKDLASRYNVSETAIQDWINKHHLIRIKMLITFDELKKILAEHGVNEKDFHG